jgi:hypothetical protein
MRMTTATNIRQMVRRTLRPFARIARKVTCRLSGYAELRTALDEQAATLARLEALLRDRPADPATAATVETGQKLVALATAAGERLNAIAAEQAALKAALPTSLKTLETTLAEALADEVSRLDGYLVFHANELREGLASLAQGEQRAAGGTPSFEPAGRAAA